MFQLFCGSLGRIFCRFIFSIKYCSVHTTSSFPYGTSWILMCLNPCEQNKIDKTDWRCPPNYNGVLYFLTILKMWENHCLGRIFCRFIFVIFQTVIFQILFLVHYKIPISHNVPSWIIICLNHCKQNKIGKTDWRYPFNYNDVPYFLIILAMWGNLYVYFHSSWKL